MCDCSGAFGGGGWLVRFSVVSVSLESCVVLCLDKLKMRNLALQRAFLPI